MIVQSNITKYRPFLTRINETEIAHHTKAWNWNKKRTIRVRGGERQTEGNDGGGEGAADEADGDGGADLEGGGGVVGRRQCGGEGAAAEDGAGGGQLGGRAEQSTEGGHGRLRRRRNSR